MSLSYIYTWINTEANVHVCALERERQTSKNKRVAFSQEHIPHQRATGTNKSEPENCSRDGLYTQHIKGQAERTDTGLEVQPSVGILSEFEWNGEAPTLDNYGFLPGYQLSVYVRVYVVNKGEILVKLVDEAI